MYGALWWTGVRISVYSQLTSRIHELHHDAGQDQAFTEDEVGISMNEFYCLINPNSVQLQVSLGILKPQ